MSEEPHSGINESGVDNAPHAEVRAFPDGTFAGEDTDEPVAEVSAEVPRAGGEILDQVRVEEPVKKEGQKVDETAEEDPELQKRVETATQPLTTLIENLKRLGEDQPGVAEALGKLQSSRDELIQKEAERYQAEVAARQERQEAQERERQEKLKWVKERTVLRISAVVAEGQEQQ
jgi:hypothetical protein